MELLLIMYIHLEICHMLNKPITFINQINKKTTSPNMFSNHNNLNTDHV